MYTRYVLDLYMISKCSFLTFRENINLHELKFVVTEIFISFFFIQPAASARAVSIKVAALYYHL